MKGDTTDDRIGDENSLVFTGEYTFSIRCGKCADIHNAQLDGKNTKPCECDCHAKMVEPYQPYVPWLPPCPCPCPHYPQPYYYTTTGTGDPMPRQGETFCCNLEGLQADRQAYMERSGRYD